MTRKLGERAQDFREQWLAPSGGWLSELVIIVSDLTGVWDLIILSGVFVGSWIVIRTSPMEIALILGLAFDLSIPLQYHNDEDLSSRHEVHLQNYWPSFMVGCMVEGAAFFFLHPDLFTLIVCIKTMFLLLVWLSRDQEGLAIRPRSSGRGSDGPSGSRSGRSSRPDGSGRDTSRRPRSKEQSSSSSNPPSNMPQSKHIPDAYKYLKRAGYSDPAIAGQIMTLNQAEKDQAKKMFKRWAGEKDPKEIKRRNAEYEERAKQAGWKPSSDSSSSSSSASKMPESKYYPNAYKYLKKAGYDDAAIAGMILAMNNSGDKNKAKQLLKTWSSEKNAEQIKRRNKEYADRAKAAGWSGSSTQAGQQPAANGSEPPNMPTCHLAPTAQVYAALKKAGYDDVAIAGMIYQMNLNKPDQALQNFQIWSQEKKPEEIKRRNASHGAKGKEIGFPDKSKMDAACGPPPGERIKRKLGIPVSSVKKLENLFKQKPYSEKLPKELQSKILEILKNPRTDEDIKQVIKVLEKAGIDIKKPEFKDGFNESDGKGGYRDIVISPDDIKKLLTAMRQKGEFTKEQLYSWAAFLDQPFSRKELEEKVLPFVERVQSNLGDGYHGTGPHRFDPEYLNKMKIAIQEKCGVPTVMIDNMILKAIYQKDKNQAQAMMDNWAKNGISKQEFEQYNKEIKWA